MPAFGIIVCPKCREYAQIVELAGGRKTRCQKCGSVLEIRKLRLFFASDSLEETISARTVIQAGVHGQESELQSAFPGTSASCGPIDVREPAEFGISTNLTGRRRFRDSRRDRNRIIIDLLHSSGGKMDTGSLKHMAEEHGIDEQKFEAMLEKLMDAGEVYEPSPGTICVT